MHKIRKITVLKISHNTVYLYSKKIYHMAGHFEEESFHELAHSNFSRGEFCKLSRTLSDNILYILRVKHEQLLIREIWEKFPLEQTRFAVLENLMLAN